MIIHYLQDKYPNCAFTMMGEGYDNLHWAEGNPDPKPSREEYEANYNFPDPVVSEEAQRQRYAQQEALAQKLQYKAQRQAEYPPITDYIDGVVKGNQAQIDAYIAACQAVKAKYPKPV